MRIVQTNLSVQSAYGLLTRGDKDITPPLSSTNDLQQYAAKLSQNAHFILLSDDTGQTQGCIAFYQNQECRFLYISHFWVDKSCRGKGFAQKMLSALIDKCPADYSDIRLEVSKASPAKSFYQKAGFVVMEDHGAKWLLSLSIIK